MNSDSLKLQISLIITIMKNQGITESFGSMMCQIMKFIEFLPPNPVRDGYGFGGWYKEPESINKWNFETDVKADGQLNLFAKWIKN